MGSSDAGPEPVKASRNAYRDTEGLRTKEIYGMRYLISVLRAVAGLAVGFAAMVGATTAGLWFVGWGPLPFGLVLVAGLLTTAAAAVSCVGAVFAGGFRTPSLLCGLCCTAWVLKHALGLPWLTSIEVASLPGLLLLLLAALAISISAESLGARTAMPNAAPPLAGPVRGQRCVE